MTKKLNKISKRIAISLCLSTLLIGGTKYSSLKHTESSNTTDSIENVRLNEPKDDLSANNPVSKNETPNNKSIQVNNLKMQLSLVAHKSKERRKNIDAMFKNYQHCYGKATSLDESIVRLRIEALYDSGYCESIESRFIDEIQERDLGELCGKNIIDRFYYQAENGLLRTTNGRDQNIINPLLDITYC